jgi:hypothetical protein
MARIALPTNAVTPCMGMDPEMFAGGGKRQREAARAVCGTCPMAARKTCERIAESLQVLGKDGRIVDGATGTFGGLSWREGVIID